MDVKLDYTIAATKFGCTVSAIRQRVGKLKLQAKEHGFALKSPGNAASGAENNAAETSPKLPKTPKKAALEAASNDNGNDGSNSDTAKGESTPIKPMTAKKPRAPRKPKLDSDGEPIAKKQKTASTPKVANKAIGKKATITEELQAGASKSTIKKEEGSDDGDSLEKKRKYGMMDADDSEEENALDGVGNPEHLSQEAILTSP